MDNLSSHHNPEALQIPKKHEKTVLFIPVRCADALSVLDNCFFAIYKSQWYKQLSKSLTAIQKKMKDIRLFNKLIVKGRGTDIGSSLCFYLFDEYNRYIEYFYIIDSILYKIHLQF